MRLREEALLAPGRYFLMWQIIARAANGRYVNQFDASTVLPTLDRIYDFIVRVNDDGRGVFNIPTVGFESIGNGDVDWHITWEKGYQHVKVFGREDEWLWTHVHHMVVILGNNRYNWPSVGGQTEPVSFSFDTPPPDLLAKLEQMHADA